MTYRLPIRRALANGTNANGNVDGSVTPVDFILAPSAGEVIEIDFVTAIFAATGNLQSLTDFLTEPGLTNGIDINLQSMGNNDFRPGVLKNNINLLQFLASTFEERAIGNDTIYTGTVAVKQPVLLNGNMGDYYQYVVNDDLTGLSLVNLIIAGSIYIG